MRNLICGRQLVDEDAWQVLTDVPDGPLPDGALLLPLPYWLAHREAMRQRPATGVWLASHEEPEALAGDLPQLTLIAIHFPQFADGRGYSSARILRERLGYRGDLRAFGDVLRDQLFYLKRSGFSSFAIRSDRSAAEALAGLDDFSVCYQGASDDPQPLFRHRSG